MMKLFVAVCVVAAHVGCGVGDDEVADAGSAEHLRRIVVCALDQAADPNLPPPP